MKTIALKWKHPDAPIITADEAKVLSDQKQQVIFFEPLTLLPLIVTRKKNTYFSYYTKSYAGNTKPKHNSGGLGRAHRLFQETFAKTHCSIDKPYKLECVLYGGDFTFLVQRIEIEKQVCGTRYADIYLELHPNCQYYSALNGCIIIEITDTHPTEPDKIQDYEQRGYACFEINISNRNTWKNPHNSEEQITSWMHEYINDKEYRLNVLTSPVTIWKYDKAINLNEAFKEKISLCICA